MSIKYYCSYIKRCNNRLRELSLMNGSNIFYLWYDFIKSTIVHGVIINHYTRGGFYKIKGCERKKSLTYGRILKAFKKLNSPEAICKLNNKHLFNSHFSPFVKRQWLYSEGMNFNEFSNLCDDCDILIIKPEGGMEGEWYP